VLSAVFGGGGVCFSSVLRTTRLGTGNKKYVDDFWHFCAGVLGHFAHLKGVGTS